MPGKDSGLASERHAGNREGSLVTQSSLSSPRNAYVEEKAQAIIKQVESHDYNPPKRDRILEWMEQQEFAICENVDDKNACNVYKFLKFPPEVYEKISSYYQSGN